MGKQIGTSMWPKPNEQNRFYFLTRDVSANVQMLRKPNFKLILSVKEICWLYEAKIFSIQVGKRILGSLTKSRVFNDWENDLFYTKMNNKILNNCNFEDENMILELINWIRLKY